MYLPMIFLVIVNHFSLKGSVARSGAGASASRHSRPATRPRGMELSSLDDVCRYCDRGMAESTARTYKSGLNCYLSFCNRFGLSAPFPVSEIILCYFVTSLAQEGIAPATSKTYLAAVCHAQVVRGLSKPRESSTLLRLRLIH